MREVTRSQVLQGLADRRAQRGEDFGTHAQAVAEIAQELEETFHHHDLERLAVLHALLDAHQRRLRGQGGRTVSRRGAQALAGHWSFAIRALFGRRGMGLPRFHVSEVLPAHKPNAHLNPPSEEPCPKSTGQRTTVA